MNMKITKALLVGAIVTAALNLNQNLRAADFSPSDLSNRAVAASPRAKEQFPWLTRQALPQSEAKARSESVLSAIKQNSALAASPRTREQFPELTRAEEPQTLATAKSGTGESQLTAVTKNSALAASPRMREQFPELARGYTSQSATKLFEVAPLK
jgi:hypothetical protein